MKLIKFDLPINGTKVKNLDELRDNLTDEILALARSGQLERWLRTRQLPGPAQAVADAVKQEPSDKELFLALCDALEVEAHPDDVKAIFDSPPEPGRFISGSKYSNGNGVELISNSLINSCFNECCVDVLVPTLSESVAQATLLIWKKSVGDCVVLGEILIELETDKVILEVPAPSSGVLLEILVGDGEVACSDQRIAIIETINNYV